MCIRYAAALLLGALVASTGVGCKRKAAAPDQPVVVKPEASATAYQTLASLHWLGKNRLAADSTARSLLSIWALPDSLKVQAQVLDKLAAAPWKFPGAAANIDTNEAAALLRPLLEDLVTRETWFEVRQLTNTPVELALGVRLDESHTALWQSNLASAAETLFGSAPIANTNGWALQPPGTSRVLQFTRAGDWILVSLSENPAASIPELLEHIKEHRRPASAGEWLQADVDVARIGSLICPGRVPATFPRLTLALSGEGDNIRTRGEVVFPKPLPLDLKDWQVPTNFIRQPLLGFTAVRGFGPWLSELPFWQALKAGPPPNQAFLWTLLGIPFTTYAIAPLLEATNTFASFCQYMVTNANAWLSTNSFGHLMASTDSTAISWVNLPVVSPSARLVETNGSQFVMAGLLPTLPSTNSFPEQLLQELGRHTNLVCYDWELTVGRMEPMLAMGQILRFFFKLPQFSTNSVSLNWAKAISTRLGNCSTAVTLVAPDRLHFTRRSTLGLSSAEIYLLCDWLESPHFPAGLYMTRAEPPTLMTRPDPPPPASGAKAPRSGPPKPGP